MYEMLNMLEYDNDLPIQDAKVYVQSLHVEVMHMRNFCCHGCHLDKLMWKEIVRFACEDRMSGI